MPFKTMVFVVVLVLVGAEAVLGEELGASGAELDEGFGPFGSKKNFKVVPFTEVIIVPLPKT
jgi:hypothetical protein